MPHDPVEMIFVGRVPRKSQPTKHFKNGKNIWFTHHKCPTCQRVVRRLANVHFKHAPICKG